MIKRRFDSIFYREQFRALLARYKVDRIAIFGTYALGRATQKSDIDFLVKFKKGASLFDLVGLKLDLEDLLGKNVDIVTANSLSKYIRRQVLKEAVYLYE